jgi:hypothetical protein
MPIEIRPFVAEWRGPVKEFNGRLTAAGARLPEDPDTEMLPQSRMYLAAEDGAVRGGYILRPQTFCFRGEQRRVAHFRLPVSEGLVNRKYARVGPLLLRSALQTEPLLYALGMRGFDRPLPRLLRAMGWSVVSIPFYFRVAHPARFLRGIQAVRETRWRAALMDLAAWTGVGWAGIRGLQWARSLPSPRGTGWLEADDFGGWADEIWETAQSDYGMTAVRDALTLGELYPAANSRFLRIRVDARGWAVLLDTRMEGDRYFGDLRVGTIVDSMARPKDAAAVIHAPRLYLEERGVDVIISNQSHAAWVNALRTDGFFRGPSNFLFAASKQLAAQSVPAAEMHMNRGDGDGPVNL